MPGSVVGGAVVEGGGGVVVTGGDGGSSVPGTVVGVVTGVEGTVVVTTEVDDAPASSSAVVVAVVLVAAVVAVVVVASSDSGSEEVSGARRSLLPRSTSTTLSEDWLRYVIPKVATNTSTQAAAKVRPALGSIRRSRSDTAPQTEAMELVIRSCNSRTRANLLGPPLTVHGNRVRWSDDLGYAAVPLDSAHVTPEALQLVVVAHCLLEHVHHHVPVVHQHPLAVLEALDALRLP